MFGVLKQQVAGGDYSIDAHAVAEAILTRRREHDPLQALCSQMLVAAHIGLAEPRERDTFPSDHRS